MGNERRTANAANYSSDRYQSVQPRRLYTTRGNQRCVAFGSDTRCHCADAREIEMEIGLNHYLVLSAVLFCIGLYGVLAKRNAVVILMCIEIMLNAVNIALVA